MEWKREEYLAHMRGEFTGKQMFCELFGPLIGLDEEWRRQGATEEEVSLHAFGWDSVAKVDAMLNTSVLNHLTTTVVEDNDQYRIEMDGYGRTAKLCKGSATIPLPIDYPVKDMDDWQKIKHWYEFSEERIDYEHLRRVKTLANQGYVVTASIPGGFDEPRQLMGEEELCIAYYEQPELIEDMLSTISNTALKVFERAIEIVPIHCLCVHEDMAGKSGSLIGPNLILEYIKPYYRRVWNVLSQNGCELFSQDSDGNMNSVIDAFLECGVNSMYPFEPAAGMDMVKTRAKYGNRLSIKGGIDKHALRGSKADVLRELEYKIAPETTKGGVVFALDHRIPNGVPIENYRYYVKKGRELLGLPEAVPAPQMRMAF